MKRYMLQNNPPVGYGCRVTLLIATMKTEDGFTWEEPLKDANTQAAKEVCKAFCMWGGHDKEFNGDNGEVYWSFEVSGKAWDQDDYKEYRYGLIPFEQLKERLESLLGPA